MNKPTTLAELAVHHPYYCHTNNFYSNDPAQDYRTWKEFYQDWATADIDYNYIFRWDIMKRHNVTGENTDKYRMLVFYIQQRKGIFKPISIESVEESDVEEIVELLTLHAQYTKEIWDPIIQLIP